MLESPLQDFIATSGHMRSGRLITRKDAGIIHNDDCHFPSRDKNDKLATMGSETEDDAYTSDIPDIPWTTCMPIDTNSFKFVEQFEWPSNFSISPPTKQQRQKPQWTKQPQQKNQRAKKYTIDEMIQMARQTTQTALPVDADVDGEEMTLHVHNSIASSDTTRDDTAESDVPFNTESSGNSNHRESNGSNSSSRGVGLITPLDSDASVEESIGSATENSNGLNSIVVSVVSTNQTNNSRNSSQSTVLSLRSESQSDWDNKWNFTPLTTTTSISPTAKTPRSSNKQHVHGKWDNRYGSPVKVSCDIVNWEAETVSTSPTSTNTDRAIPGNRIRKLNKNTTRSHNDSTTNTTSHAVTSTATLEIHKKKSSPSQNGNSGTSSTTTTESSTIANQTSPHRIPRRRIQSDTTATTWSATIDRSARVVRPRYKSATSGSSTSRNDISKSSTPRTEPIRSWSIFDQSGHFCTCTACASVVVQTPLQEEEFYTHQQRRCCRGPFEKEIAELIADIKNFGCDNDEEDHDDDTANGKTRSYHHNGDALLVLANPLRELSLLCRDVRNIHAIRLFGGVQAVVGAMNALRQQAHEHLQRRQRKKQECDEAGTTNNHTLPPPNTGQSVNDDKCYSTALRYGCSVLQYVAREHAQSNSSSSSPGTFAHRISLVMLLSGGGNSNSGVQGIVQAMKLFPLDHSLQRTGTRALMNMSNSSRDACQAILDTTFSNDNIDSRGDIALATGSTVHGGNAYGYSGIVEELVTVLENFPHCPSIKESALVTICNLFEKVPDAAMKQLAPRREAAPLAEQVQVSYTNESPGERRSKPSKKLKAMTVEDEGLSTSPHPSTEISTEPCSQSIGEIKSITTDTTPRTTMTPPTSTKIPKECTFTTPLPTTPPVETVSSPRAVVKVEDITLLLDDVLRIGPKRHYHYENNNSNNANSDDDSDDTSALWNRVYRLEQRLLIGEVLENVFRGHPRLCFEEKKCNV